MSFEVFTKRMVPLAKEPYVTIQKRGVMSFNAAAHAALGAPEAIELLFDPDDRVIGVKAVDKSVEHAYPIRGQTARAEGTFMVSGTAFTKYYKIDTTVSIRRKAKVVEDGMLLIDLKDPGTVVTSNRSGSRKAGPEQDAPGAP